LGPLWDAEASNRDSPRLTRTIPSRGAWLAGGLCCPAARSSLTMASSEPLDLSRRPIFFARRRADASGCPGGPEGPQFTPRVFLFAPPSVPRRSPRLHATVTSPRTPAGLHHLCTGSASAWPPRSAARARRFTRGGVTRPQSSLYATARRVARPTPERAFTLELSPPMGRPKGRRV